MKKDKRNICIYSRLLLLAIVLFCGCSRTSPPYMIQKKIEENQKTTAPLSISYRIPDRIAVNEPIPVIITILVQENADDLVLILKTGKDLEMAPAAGETRYGSRPAKATLSKEILITAKKAGHLYLNVFISGRFNGRRMARAGAVPVIAGQYAGNGSLEKADPVSTGPQGQPIITMPAQEKADN